MTSQAVFVQKEAFWDSHGSMQGSFSEKHLSKSFAASLSARGGVEAGLANAKAGRKYETPLSEISSNKRSEVAAHSAAETVTRGNLSLAILLVKRLDQV